MYLTGCPLWEDTSQGVEGVCTEISPSCKDSLQQVCPNDIFVQTNRHFCERGRGPTSCACVKPRK